jgi:ABC-type nitrate/sulfonate/bicarbonate transport system permease component
MIRQIFRTKYEIIRPLVVIIIALAAWEFAARSGLWSPILFPPLAKIASALWAFVSRPEGITQSWTTLYRAFGGFAAAAVAGVLLGMLMGRSAFLAALLDPLFSGTYAVPKLALFPIFIFVFGLGSLSKIALIFLECLYPMTIITYHGARSVDRVGVDDIHPVGDQAFARKQDRFALERRVERIRLERRCDRPDHRLGV